MIVCSIPNLRIQHDAVLDLLRVQWTGGSDMQPFRRSIRGLVGLANSLRVAHCLLDMDSFPDLSTYDQIWLGRSWLPDLKCLGCLQQVVLIIQPHRVYHQLTVESLLEAARPHLACDVQFFTDPRRALQWFTDGTGRLPLLTAEWESTHSAQWPVAAGHYVYAAS